MRELWARLMAHKGKLLTVTLLRVVSSVTALFLPYIMSDIVNVGITNRDMSYITSRCLQMILVALVSLAASIGTIYMNATITTSFTGKLQRDLFTQIMGMSFEDYSSFGTSSLITRCNEDVFTIEEVISQITYVLISFPVLFIGGVILTMQKDLKVGLIMLLISPIILLLVWLVTRNMGKMWENSDRYIDVQNKLVRERLFGLRVIRAFDKEDYEHERISKATETMAVNIIKANVLAGFLTPICTILLNMVMVVMLYTGSMDLVNGGSVTAGDLIAAVQYIALVLNGLLILSFAMAFLPHLKVSLRRVNEILNTKIKEPEQSEGILEEQGLTVSHVSFTYPGAEEETLTDISMEIPKGEKIAIIGGTGSGKSTLIKLLMGFYPIEQGEIRLGEREYSNLSPETIRENLSVALQKSMIFEGTIGDNMRYGQMDASEEDLERVSEIAQILDFVREHEEGFSYMLTQSGANISGGQKQRINIARTILKKASVYIFDDSFSALDFLTESKLRKALNTYLEGKTQIIITQRAATAMSCDRIYVLDDGRLVGSGSHKELLDTCSIYREIYDSQIGGDAHAC